MNIKHRSIMLGALLAMSVLPALVSSCSNNSFPDATEKVTPYIVQIVVADNVSDSMASSVVPIGFGLLINRAGLVLTAAHVIDVGENITRSEGTTKTLRVVIPPYKGLGYSSQPGTGTNTFDVVAVDANHDLALLKLQTAIVPNPFNGNESPMVNYATGVGGTLNIEPLRLDQHVPRVGTSLAVSGYPFPKTTTDTGKMVSGAESIIRDAQMAREDKSVLTRTLAGCYETSIPTDANLSGSPVYLANSGAIVGIYIGILDRPGGVLVPAEYVARFLNNEGIAWSGK